MTLVLIAVHIVCTLVTIQRDCDSARAYLFTLRSKEPSMADIHFLVQFTLLPAVIEMHVPGAELFGLLAFSGIIRVVES